MKIWRSFKQDVKVRSESLTFQDHLEMKLLVSLEAQRSAKSVKGARSHQVVREEGALWREAKKKGRALKPF